MFDREKEVRDLLEYYNQCVARGINCGILVYGWRRVGKTTILKNLVKRINGIYLDCIWISDPFVFIKALLDQLKIDEHEKKQKLSLLLAEGDPLLLLKKAFDFILDYSTSLEQKLSIIMDEFHVFIDKIATRIARVRKQSKEIIIDDLLGLLKGIIESKKVFWIFATSIGWKKLRETLIKPKKLGSPLIAILKKYRIEPFDRETGVKFALEVNPKIDLRKAEEIYNITGGIPKFIEVIAINLKHDENVLKRAVELLKNGEFDDFFDNIIKFVSEISKRDYTLLIQVLKSIEFEEKTANDIAKHLGIDLDSAYILAEELAKIEILEKKKEKRRVSYKIKYPLLSLWVTLKVQPERDIYNLLASKFGIAIESYIKELLQEYIMKNLEVKIFDDTDGTYLMGTTDVLEFRPKRILSKKYARAKFGSIGDVDLILETHSGDIYLIEIKSTGIKLNKRDIRELENATKSIGKGAKGMFIIVEPKGISYPLVAYAVKKNLIILTGEALRLLAKKVNFPHW